MSRAGLDPALPKINMEDTMSEDDDKDEFGALFWLALGIGFTGLVGFLLTAGAAMGGM